MNSQEFFKLLTDEVKTYKQYLETDGGDWIVKGFIDVDKNVYTITNDTKVVSKIMEILLIPKLKLFAGRNHLTLELPSRQNYYPDLTFIDAGGNLFAVDFKSSYYDGDRINGLTLGSYWGYFRQRDRKKNTDYPYGRYKCHLVIGMLYKKSVPEAGEKTVYGIDELQAMHSVIEQFIFFVQPKWKIATDAPGSGNTRNIGGETSIETLVNGNGMFAPYGEDIFDDYWMNYYNMADAEHVGIGKPHYHDLKSYAEYLRRAGCRSKVFDKEA